MNNFRTNCGLRSGDMIADTDMEITVHLKQEIAEALAYQDCWGDKRVYGEDNVTKDAKSKHELNVFLNYWLTNLINPGHCIRAETTTELNMLYKANKTLPHIKIGILSPVQIIRGQQIHQSSIYQHIHTTGLV